MMTTTRKRIPVVVEPASVLVAGGINASHSPLMVGQLRQRARPALGGYSAAHYLFRYGTIATAVRDSRHGEVAYILSNNHVLAKLNKAQIGDPILQPARDDGGIIGRDTLARLSRYVPLRFGPTSTNVVDAAIAEARFCDVERRIYGIGYIHAFRRNETIKVGEKVQKVGRSTGMTWGSIVGVHYAAKVSYGPGMTAVFRDQIITTGICVDGDSGSLVFDLEFNVIGLVFGVSRFHTVVNYIETVQSELGIIVADKVA